MVRRNRPQVTCPSETSSKSERKGYRTETTTSFSVPSLSGSSTPTVGGRIVPSVGNREVVKDDILTPPSIHAELSVVSERMGRGIESVYVSESLTPIGSEPR